MTLAAALIAPANGRDLDRSPASARVKYFRSPDATIDREHGDDDRRCLPPVSGLGTQWIGIKGALNAAKKDWMERVRYDHGESFIDLSHAAAIGSRCSRVSIGSLLGRVMYRCEVIARPCQARFEHRTKTASIDGVPPVTALTITVPAVPPPQTAAPKKITTSPLAVWKRLTHPLRRHDYRAPPAPAQPADQRPANARYAALLIGEVVMGALGTMEMAPHSVLGYARALLNAIAEFPILYRALSIPTP